MSRSTAIAPAIQTVSSPSTRSGGALLLGIVLRNNVVRACHDRIRFIQDTHQSLGVGLLFFTIHVFRMTTFFLMGGFFAGMSFITPGDPGVVRDKLQKIADAAVDRFADPVHADGPHRNLGRGFPERRFGPGASSWPPVLPNFPLTGL